MSNSMGIASLFVVSSLVFSPLVSASESQTFVARNAARQAQLEKSQQQAATKAQDLRTRQKLVKQQPDQTAEKG
ncbi:hypothetical protein [Pseudomonas sp. DWP3-1-2]|uniref:hypothetical protein n=1 Tax=Pseudomonas sp. DWP3-1-2 TaxID=2804645 RepID=UPI003CE992EA